MIAPAQFWVPAIDYDAVHSAPCAWHGVATARRLAVRRFL